MDSLTIKQQIAKVLDDHSAHPFMRWPTSPPMIPCKGGGCYKGYPHDLSEELLAVIEPYVRTMVNDDVQFEKHGWPSYGHPGEEEIIDCSKEAMFSDLQRIILKTRSIPRVRVTHV